MSHIVAKNKIKVLTGDWYEHFKAHGCYLAGGALTSIFTNKEVNDLDIYFPTKTKMFRFVSEMFKPTSYGLSEMGQFECIATAITDKSIVCKDRVQLVIADTFKTPQDIFDCFDYTINMAAYSFATEEFTFHPKFFEHLAQRKLVFNTGTRFPLVSLFRVDKYTKRGYSISKQELSKLCLAINKLKLESWEDLASHLGGLYGEQVFKLAKDDLIFSLEEAINVLSEEEISSEGYYGSNVTDREIEKLLESIKPNCLKDIKPLYYKMVGKDLKSCMAPYNCKIQYEVGKLVRCDNGGIYYSTADVNTYLSSNSTYIQLEPLDNCKIGDTLVGEVMVVKVLTQQDVDSYFEEIDKLLEEEEANEYI